MAKRFLDELKWHPEKKLDEARITYIHRGAPGDEMTIKGRDIVRLEKSYFIIMRNEMETSIPFHRIKKIQVSGNVIYKKR